MLRKLLLMLLQFVARGGSMAVEQSAESSCISTGYESIHHYERHGESLLPTMPVVESIQNMRPVQHLAAGLSFNCIHPRMECIQSLQQHVAATQQQLGSTYDQANQMEASWTRF